MSDSIRIIVTLEDIEAAPRAACDPVTVAMRRQIQGDPEYIYAEKRLGEKTVFKVARDRWATEGPEFVDEWLEAYYAGEDLEGFEFEIVKGEPWSSQSDRQYRKAGERS